MILFFTDESRGTLHITAKTITKLNLAHSDKFEIEILKIGSHSSRYPDECYFLTSELANKAKLTILSARDTTRAWVPGRGIKGRDVGVYKTRLNTWLSSMLENQPRSFRYVSLILLCLVLSFSGTMHPVW